MRKLITAAAATVLLTATSGFGATPAFATAPDPVTPAAELTAVTTAYAGSGSNATAATSHSSSSADTAAELTPAAIDAYVSRYVESTGLPGVSVAVVKDGQVIHAAGYGHDAQGKPLTANSPMSLASLSKSFTAMAVVKLAEEGRIRLDAPVAEQLPEFKMDDPRAAGITVRQLLNQRSGIADSTVDIHAVKAAGSLSEAVAALAGGHLSSDPGSRYRYSNPNYVLAARLVEVASGESFPSYLDRAVLRPLGMTGTTATNTLPDGHIDVYGVWVPRPELAGFLLGSGGMVSTAHDLARWLTAQQTAGKVVSAAGLSTMHTPPDGGDYGMGWGRHGDRLEHGGNLFTATGSLTLLDNGYGFAVLSNSAGLVDDAYPLVDGLVALSEGRTPADGSSSLLITDLVLAALTILALGLGVLGVRRAGRWAGKRTKWTKWLRLAVVLSPVAVLAAYLPMIEFVLGGRTVTWAQLIYSSPALLLLVLVAALAGLTTATARILKIRELSSSR